MNKSEEGRKVCDKKGNVAKKALEIVTTNDGEMTLLTNITDGVKGEDGVKRVVGEKVRVGTKFADRLMSHDGE
jgi:hypothetical protein